MARKSLMSAEVKHTALIVFAEHWTGALLRAELLERGWDAVCAHSMAEAVLLAPGRGFTVALVDQAALSSRDQRLLAWATGHDRIRLVLLTSAVSKEACGPWHRVLRRPLSFGMIADALAAIVSEASSTPRTESSNEDPAALGGFAVRLGPPWPRIVCIHCHRSRHYEVARDDGEACAIEADLPAFVVEHARAPSC